MSRNFARTFTLVGTFLFLISGCAPPRIVNRLTDRASMGHSPADSFAAGRRSRHGSEIAQVGHEESVSNSQSPPVTGKRLGILPGSTAADRALELMGQLEAMNGQFQELNAQLEEKQAIIEHKDKKLVEAVREIQSAREELVQVRERLGTWQQELKTLRERIRNTEAENLSNMQAILTLLQQLIDMGDDRGAGVVPAPPLPMSRP